MKTGPTVLIALGSNQGNSAALIQQAVERLRALAVGPVRVSSLRQTAPVDCPPGSPMFVNAAVAFTAGPELTPETLLATLQEMEKEFGRRPKKVLNEPRPLDLDLIAFGNEVRQTPELTLPHPRAHLRRFVLEPLNEVAPDFILPGQRRTVGELLQALPPGE
jgi:2-amino-4-hydroxy-6-hydroxymethyldihydropteridine diphosphokinase